MKRSARATMKRFTRAVIVLVLIAVFIPAVSCFAQEKAKPVQGDQQDVRADLEPGDKGYKDPVKMTEKGVKVDGIIAGTLLLGGKVYQMARWSKCYRKSGSRLPWVRLRKNQIVDVEYYTGGTSNEGYPFKPDQLVVISVRVISGEGERGGSK